MKDTVLIGKGSHAKDIQAIVRAIQRDLGTPSALTIDLPMFDDADNPTEDRIREVERSPVIIGVNNPTTRYRISKRFSIQQQALIHPSSRSVDACFIGMSSVIAPRVTIVTGVEIGDHTHVNYATSMTRCKIGDFVTIGPGVTICGDVEIGDLSFIGAGAVISNLVSIGIGCVIGAGAVVLKDVPDYAVVVGVPARQAPEGIGVRMT